MQNIDKPDACYDWVICNHVLEHVQDDAKAVQELLRITKDSGVWQFAIPSPIGVAKTKDWGFPDAKLHGHYRIYGEDFMETRFAGILNESNTCAVISTDTVTGSQDFVFFVSKSPEVLAKIKASFCDSMGNPPLQKQISTEVLYDRQTDENKSLTPYMDKIRNKYLNTNIS